MDEAFFSGHQPDSIFVLVAFTIVLLNLNTEILKMKQLTIYNILICLLCSSISNLAAQQIIPAQELTIQGRVFQDSPHFHRVDTAKYNTLPSRVKTLLTNAPGMYTSFRSNTKKLAINWTTKDAKLGNNSTAIMSRGFDVYVKEPQGWQFAGAARPSLTSPSSKFPIIEEMDDREKEFLLYFPLYKELITFELEIDQEASFSPTTQQFNTKIVIYGSSIVHGASASRPGLAYPAQLARKLNAEVINLGVSGNAKMELSLAQMINEIKSVDLIIMDCVPNSSPEQVTERTFAFVKELRKKHPNTPILMIESINREISNYNLKWQKRLLEQNGNFKKEYTRLLASGEKNLYYIPADDLIGHDSEGTVDGTHPTDVGFSRMIDIIAPKIKEILENI